MLINTLCICWLNKIYIYKVHSTCCGKMLAFVFCYTFSVNWKIFIYKLPVMQLVMTLNALKGMWHRELYWECLLVICLQVMNMLIILCRIRCTYISLVGDKMAMSESVYQFTKKGGEGGGLVERKVLGWIHQTAWNRPCCESRVVDGCLRNLAVGTQMLITSIVQTHNLAASSSNLPNRHSAPLRNGLISPHCARGPIAFGFTWHRVEHRCRRMGRTCVSATDGISSVKIKLWMYNNQSLHGLRMKRIHINEFVSVLGYWTWICARWHCPLTRYLKTVLVKVRLVWEVFLGGGMWLRIWIPLRSVSTFQSESHKRISHRVKICPV